MMASNGLSGQVQDRSPQILLDSNKDPHCCMQPTTITLLPDEAAIIYFHNFAMFPPSTTIKISCKEQIKIKFHIALWQHCDQSAKDWWSTQSSARQ